MEPDQLLTAGTLATAADVDDNIYRWNQTTGPFEESILIHGLFERQVRKTPHATALVTPTDVVTYIELNRRANRLAHHLRARGAGPGRLVGLCLDRSPDLVVALLAVLKSGAAYVPVEPNWPAARVAQMGADSWVAAVTGPDIPAAVHDLLSRSNSPAHILVCGSAIADRPPMGIPPDWLHGLPEHNPECLSTPDNCAYVIFTSGSTGRPKGVVVRHRPVINLLTWVNDTFCIRPADRLLFITSVAFDLSVYDVFGVLAAGGSIRIASAAETRDPAALARILATESITCWDSAPAALDQLASLLPATTSGAGPSLRLVFLSGDWIPLQLPPTIQAAFPGVRVVALGGATEATVWSNYFDVLLVDPAWSSIPYGRPIRNARYYVLDGDRRPCPIGAPGNLFIAGGCLADGYLDDPDLTARKFLPDPFHPGDRMYDTGDRARHFPDGTLEFLGRRDNQVKVRGFRVETTDVEKALAAFPGIRNGVVLARGDRGAQQLVAFIVADDLPPAPALRRHLQALLPDYMIPSAFVHVPAVPITANGKVDRAALLAMAAAPASSATARSPAEAAVLDVWREVLPTPPCSLHDNFFECGGDSLRAFRVISRLTARGFPAQLSHLARHPTIAGFAAEIERQVPATVANLPPVLPLTPMQHWFFGRGLRDAEHYSVAVAYHLAPGIDKPTLCRALDLLAARHDVFRLRFPADGRGHTMQYADASTSVCETLDLPAPGAAELAAHIRRLRASICLDTGPLHRAALAHFADGSPPMLLLIFHHLIIDGISLRIITDDLTAVLHHLLAGREPPQWGGRPFGEWATRLARYAQTPQAHAEGDYWLTLPWTQAGPLPRDTPAGRNTYRASRTLHTRVGQEATGRLLTAAARHRLSLEQLLLAACAHALARWTGRAETLIDLTAHGRHEPFPGFSTAQTAGYFTVNVPFFLPAPGAAGPLETARAIATRTAALPAGGIGFGILRHLAPDLPELAPFRKLPQPEIKFNLHAPDEMMATDLLKPAHLSDPGSLHPDNSRLYLLNIECIFIGEELGIDWKYGADIHAKATIRRLATDFLRVLRELGSEAGRDAPAREPPGP
jgi:amino acid adenylation domain-containing protein/non-ribosomal peptide synthase protein (TIGR01720 family)